MSGADFVSVEPFDVDDGQLDGLLSELVFVLGVEFEMVRQAIGRGEDVERVVHMDNCRRIDAMFDRHGYYRRWSIHDDWSDVVASQNAASLEAAE